MFSKSNYENLIKEIESLADEKHSKFHINLVPNIENNYIVLGVAIPKLRKLAKELMKRFDNLQDIEYYFSIVGNQYYEEIMLQGIVIGYIKCDFIKKLEYISEFVPKISDWAVCDVFCSSIKLKPNNLVDYREFINGYLNSNDEFELRFAIVSLMQNYISDDYIDETLNTLKNISDEHYYVEMAIAWALSVCYVKYPIQTMKFFKQKVLSKSVQNKAIQKCRESIRVSEEDKRDLLTLKL